MDYIDEDVFSTLSRAVRDILLCVALLVSLRKLVEGRWTKAHTYGRLGTECLVVP